MIQHVGVADELRRVGKDAAPRSMIPVMMAVDHVADGDAETAVQFAPEPGREVGIDRIRQHDALVGDHEHGTVVVVGGTVNAIGDLGDGAARFVLGEGVGRKREWCDQSADHRGFVDVRHGGLLGGYAEGRLRNPRYIYCHRPGPELIA